MRTTPTHLLAAPGLAPAPMLLLALAACYFVWGSTYLAIRLALESFPPFFQMATRFLLAGGLLLAWTACVQKNHCPAHGNGSMCWLLVA